MVGRQAAIRARPNSIMLQYIAVLMTTVVRQLRSEHSLNPRWRTFIVVPRFEGLCTAVSVGER